MNERHKMFWEIFKPLFWFYQEIPWTSASGTSLQRWIPSSLLAKLRSSMNKTNRLPSFPPYVKPAKSKYGLLVKTDANYLVDSLHWWKMLQHVKESRKKENSTLSMIQATLEESFELFDVWKGREDDAPVIEVLDFSSHWLKEVLSEKRFSDPVGSEEKHILPTHIGILQQHSHTDLMHRGRIFLLGYQIL